MKRLLTRMLCSAAVLLAVANVTLLAQDDNPTLPAYFGVSPWISPSGQDQQTAIISGGSIPMSTFFFGSTKSGSNVTETIVGRSPFLAGKTTTNINVILIPMIMTIGSTTFNSTAIETCGNGAG